MSRRTRELLQLEKSRGLDDFYWYTKYPFGDNNPWIYPHVHGELCRELQAAGERLLSGKIKTSEEILILMPRSSLKSAIGQSFESWMLEKDPNLRIMNGSVTLDLAKANLEIVKARRTSEDYTEIFGDSVARDDRGKPIKWNLDEVVFSGRTRAIREPSISVGAPGKLKVGSHYDIIILDDIVNASTVSTPEQIRKTLQYYGSAQSLLDPGGIMIIIGTRWSYDDLYGYLMGSNEWGKVIPDRVIFESCYNKDGSLWFPERLTHEYLEDRRIKQGAYMFACQYENNPTNSDTAVFLREDFRYIGDPKEDEKKRKIPKLVTRFMTVDPSRGESLDSDFSAIVVASQDDEGIFYIEHAEQRRCRPSELIDWIYDLHKVFKFDRIGIEQVGMQSVYDMIMDRVLQGTAKFIPVHQVKTTNKTSKVMRIRQLEPYFKTHRVFMMPGLKTLEDQLIRFPNISKDDLIDALSMVPKVAYRPGSEEEKEDKKKHHRRDDVVRIDWEKLRAGKRSFKKHFLRWKY